MNPSTDRPVKADSSAPADLPVKLMRLRRSILARKGLLGVGDGFSVALHSCGRILYAGSNRFGQADAQAWLGISDILCSEGSIVALMADGTVRSLGRDAQEVELTDALFGVRRLACGSRQIAALMGDGRVVISHESLASREERTEWPPMIDVVCGRSFTAALGDDGRVYLSGGSPRMQYTVRGWEQIAGIFADSDGDTLYAMTAVGGILSTGRLPRAVRLWKNLVYMAAAGDRICAISAKGRLLSNRPLPRELREDGEYLSCAVGKEHMLALTQDGALLAGGRDDFGQCSVARFGKLFRYFEDISSERKLRLQALDRSERAYQMRRTDAARFSGRLVCNERITACITAYGRVLTSGGFAAGKAWDNVRTLVCGNGHLLALHKNGRVSAEGNDIDGCCAVSDWSDIRSVAAGNYHSFGVTMDGRVHFCGLNDKGQGNVSDWSSIRSVAAADAYTVGVTYSGELLVAGLPPFAPELLRELRPHPVAVIATETHAVCLYGDGTVQSTVPNRGTESSTEMDDETAAWRHISAIAAGPGFTVGLCYNGTVVAAGDLSDGRNRVADWKQVVAIGCGRRYIAGLTADGRMLTAGVAQSGSKLRRGTPLSDADQWQDLIAFVCGPCHLVALNRDGQVVACGLDADDQCAATAHFTLFQNANCIYRYVKYHAADEEPAGC